MQCVKRSRHAWREQPRPRHQVEAQISEMRERRPAGSRPLAADHLCPPALRIMNQNGNIPTRAIEVRLDDLQRESGGDARIESVAPAFENTHADRGCNPMRGRDDSKRPLNLGPGRESVRIDKAHSRTVRRTWGLPISIPQTPQIGHACLYPNHNIASDRGLSRSLDQSRSNRISDRFPSLSGQDGKSSFRRLVEQNQPLGA